MSGSEVQQLTHIPGRAEGTSPQDECTAGSSRPVPWAGSMRGLQLLLVSALVYAGMCVLPTGMFSTSD